MTTKANGNGSLAPEPASDTPIRAVDDDWEGLKRVRKESAKPERDGKFSADDAFTGLGVVFFIICWIVFGVAIFHALTSMGIFVALAVIVGIIGGFIATVITWMIGMAGGF